MHKSFLQTHEWLAFQKATGKKVWHFNDGIVKANIIKHPLSLGKNYLYIPHGPEVDFGKIGIGMKNAMRHFADFITRTANEEGSVFVKLEPLLDAVPEFMHGAGLRPRWTRRTLQPHRTLVCDLTVPEKEMTDRMHQKTRYNVNLARKKGLVLFEEDNVEVFWNLLKKTTEHDGFCSHERDYYEKMLSIFAPKNAGQVQAKLYTMIDGKTPVCGAIMLTYGKTVYYLHGAMDRDYRSLMGPYLMHWELMKKYKALGYEDYDFWGIDSRRWPGVTRFKMGFGGRVIEYPGSFELKISGLWYFLYRMVKRMR